MFQTAHVASRVTANTRRSQPPPTVPTLPSLQLRSTAYDASPLPPRLNCPKPVQPPSCFGPARPLHFFPSPPAAPRRAAPSPYHALGVSVPRASPLRPGSAGHDLF